MPNPFFLFKQFTVHHDKCAMKVCTDACLFGAWAAGKIQNSKCKIQNILDIGCGTGLLSLMLAQKTGALIDAVEMDEQAAEQASENVRASPWANRIKVYQSTIQQFNSSTTYDFIISNPPFYENELKGPHEKKNAAHHSSSLSFSELLSSIKRLLKRDGEFAILLPYRRGDVFIKLAKQVGFHLHEVVNVRQTSTHNFFRCMLWFKSISTNTNTAEISIKETNEYTDDFVSLLKDYYLHL